MMRVFWEEWRSAHEFASFRILPLLAIGAALGLLITGGHPGALFFALAVAGLVGGILSGTQRWSRLPARDWVGLEGVPAWGYALGKVFGLTAVWAVWLVFLAPPLVLVSLNWAVPGTVVLGGLAWAWAAALVAQGVGAALCWSASSFAKVVAALVVFFWVVSTVQAPWVQGWNPLWQLWHLFRDPSAPFAAGFWGALLGAAAGLWALTVLFLARREVR